MYKSIHASVIEAGDIDHNENVDETAAPKDENETRGPIDDHAAGGISGENEVQNDEKDDKQPEGLQEGLVLPDDESVQKESREGEIQALESDAAAEDTATADEKNVESENTANGINTKFKYGRCVL